MEAVFDQSRIASRANLLDDDVFAGLYSVFLPNAIKTAQFTIPHFLLSLAFFLHWEPDSSTKIFPIYAIDWTLMYEWYFYISFMLFMSVKIHLLLEFFVFLSMIIIGANLILRFNHDFALVTFFPSQSFWSFSWEW